MAEVTKPKFFINFQWSVYHAQIMQLLMFFMKIFFTLLIVQKVNFLQLHSLFLIFKNSQKNILGFAMALMLVILSYSIFGYRMYGNYLYEFSTIINTFYALFQVLMGNQNLHDSIIDVNQSTIFLYLIVFFMVINYGMIFIFMGLINNSYRRQ